MKAQSHPYVILVRNHLPKNPNWIYTSKECKGEKKLFSCPMCGPQFHFSTSLKDHIEKNHKSEDFTVSGVWKNTLVEFMKAQSHSYVILVRNHLPKIPNWNYTSKECKGEKSRFHALCVAHYSISLPEWKTILKKNHKLQDLTVSEVWKNTLVEFMKAQSHSFVILVRNHLPKIPNWNYTSKEC